MRLGSLDYSDNVLYNFNNNEAKLTDLSKQLSSGLRINSAADDPSGYTMATHMQTVSQGLDQGQQSVQNAKNLLTVADSAMGTITEILQRMRSLVVEANSDLNSPQDQQNLQAEIDQLALEINRISQNTNFNGKPLLDGSLASTQTQPAKLIYPMNPAVSSNGKPLIDLSTTFVNATAEEAQFSFSVDSYDATTNQLQVTFTVSSPDPSFGPVQQNVVHVTPGNNYFDEFGAGSNPYYVYDNNGNPVFDFNFNPLSASDVGKTAVGVTLPQVMGNNGHALEVNTGTGEGSTVAISIGAMDTLHLGVNQIQVGDLLANQAAEARIDNALDNITSTQADLGAQEVSLGYAADNAATQEINQTASESSIRDADIGATVTAFTKEQILVSVGTSVLSQMQVSTLSLAKMLMSAFGG